MNAHINELVCFVFLRISYFSVLFCHPCYVFGVPINLCTVLLKYHQRRNSDSHIRRYSFKTCTINSQELKLCICYLFFKMLRVCPCYICGQIGQNTLHTTCQGLKYSNDRFIFTLCAYVFVRMCVHNVHAWCTWWQEEVVRSLGTGVTELVRSHVDSGN